MSPLPQSTLTQISLIPLGKYSRSDAVVTASHRASRADAILSLHQEGSGVSCRLPQAVARLHAIGGSRSALTQQPETA